MNACSFDSNRTKSNLVRVTLASDHGLTLVPQIFERGRTPPITPDQRPRIEERLSRLFHQTVKKLLRPDTSPSPALTEPAHMALHSPFSEFQLTAAVGARAHEHFTAA